MAGNANDKDDMIADFKRRMAERKERYKLFKQLVVYASDNGEISIPTKEEFLLSEIINGTLSYIGGETGKWRYRDNTYAKHGMRLDIYIDNAYKHFEKQLEENKLKLRDDTNKMLIGMTKPIEMSPSMDDAYLLTDIEGFNLFRNSMKSTELIAAKDARLVREELDAMDCNKRKDIEGIGTAMRPEIAEDLKFIGKTYHY